MHVYTEWPFGPGSFCVSMLALGLLFSDLPIGGGSPNLLVLDALRIWIPVVTIYPNPFSLIVPIVVILGGVLMMFSNRP